MACSYGTDYTCVRKNIDISTDIPLTVELSGICSWCPREWYKEPVPLFWFWFWFRCIGSATIIGIFSDHNFNLPSHTCIDLVSNTAEDFKLFRGRGWGSDRGSVLVSMLGLSRTVKVFSPPTGTCRIGLSPQRGRGGCH